MQSLNRLRYFFVVWFLIFASCAQSVFNDPSAGACSAGGGNVGNGTCTISQVSYAALTETLTFTATTVGPGATFTVSGSSSGSLSSITSGSAQTVLNAGSMPIVAVTLSNGGVAYAIGDVFTVATTAGTELIKSKFDLFTLAQVCSNGCSTSAVLSIPDGANSAPALIYASDTDLGRYRVSADREALVSGGATTFDIETTSTSSNVAFTVTTPTSSTGGASASFTTRNGGGDPRLTFTIAAVDSFSIGIDNSVDDSTLVIANSSALGTTNRLTIGSTIAALLPITSTGSVSGTALTPTSATIPSNGIYLPAANTVGIATNSTSRITIGSLGQITQAAAAATLAAFTRDSTSAGGITTGNTTNVYWLGADSAGNFEGRVTDNGGTQFLEVSNVGAVVVGATGGSLTHQLNGTLTQTIAKTTANIIELDNTDNTTATSDQVVWIQSGGSSGGDPYWFLNVSGTGNSVYGGMDNSVSDNFVIGEGNRPGDNDMISIAIASGVVNHPYGIRTKYSTANVSAVPTDAEFDSACGDPATVGSGFICIVNDNNGGTAEYTAWTDGTNWFYVAGVKAL